MMNGDTERSKFVIWVNLLFLQDLECFILFKLTVSDEKFVDLIENCRK